MEKGHKGPMITSKIVAKGHKKSRKSQKSKLSKKNVIMKEIKRGKVTKTGRFRLKKIDIYANLHEIRSGNIY